VAPILRMISEFITIGTFEDPFNEFFVEKLQPDHRVVYKLAGAHKSKVPIFFKETASVIFKVGCDINLLKENKQKTGDSSELQYYRVCSF